MWIRESTCVFKLYPSQLDQLIWVFMSQIEDNVIYAENCAQFSLFSPETHNGSGQKISSKLFMYYFFFNSS